RRVAKDAGEPLQHALCAAKDCRAESGVSFVEPRGEADAAGDGIELGYAEAMLRQQQVRPDHPRDLVLEHWGALEFDELGRLALVEPAGDPFRLFALGALAVK